MDLTRGVDVHPIYQSPIDMQQVAEQVGFLIVKLTEGKGLLSWQADGTNESHTWYQRARDAGLLVGGYHVCHPENNTPAAEANFYTDELETAGWEPGRDLPPILDLEPFVFTQHDLSGGLVVDWCREFCETVDTRLGLTDRMRRCGFYAGASIFGYFDWGAITSDRWFWHGGYQATEWPTDLPSTNPAIYQKVNSPNTLVGGVGGSDLDIDVATPEVLALLAPDYGGIMTTAEQDALITRLLDTKIKRVTPYTRPTGTVETEVTIRDVLRYTHYRTAQSAALDAGQTEVLAGLSTLLGQLPDAVAAKVATSPVEEDAIRNAVTAAIDDSGLKGLLPGQ